jgi:hypothetical protein
MIPTNSTIVMIYSKIPAIVMGAPQTMRLEKKTKVETEDLTSLTV